MIRPISSSYRVKQGDTLWRIAKLEYGDPMLYREIARANYLPNPNFLLVGMNLKLPAVAHSPRYRPRVSATPSLSPAPHQPSTAHPSLSPIASQARIMPASTSLHSLPAGERSFSSEGVAPARQLQFPPIQFSFDALQPIVIPGPVADITLKLTGSVTLQRKELMTSIEIDKRGPVVTSELKTEYDNKFNKTVLSTKVKWDPSKPNSAELEGGFTVTTKVGGHDFLTYGVSAGPGSIKFSLKPRDIEGDLGDMKFKGNLGYEMEIKLKPPRPDTAPAFEFSISPNALRVTNTEVVAVLVVAAIILCPEGVLAWEAVSEMFAFAGAAAL